MSSDPQKDLSDLINQYVSTHSLDRAKAILAGIFEEIRVLREDLTQERNIADLLYHSIKAGHPIGGKRMNGALETAEIWMKYGRKS